GAGALAFPAPDRRVDRPPEAGPLRPEHRLLGAGLPDRPVGAVPQDDRAAGAEAVFVQGRDVTRPAGRHPGRPAAPGRDAPGGHRPAARRHGPLPGPPRPARAPLRLRAGDARALREGPRDARREPSLRGGAVGAPQGLPWGGADRAWTRRSASARTPQSGLEKATDFWAWSSAFFLSELARATARLKCRAGSSGWETRAWRRTFSAWALPGAPFSKSRLERSIAAGAEVGSSWSASSSSFWARG